MYKIEMPRHGEDVAYAKAYATKLIPLIEDYLNNGKVLEVAVKNRGTVHVAVGKNTLTRSFLQKLSNITFLEKYLLMKPTTQVKLIQRLEATKYPDELIFSSITAGRCDKHKMLAFPTFDHFNKIMYDIFVNSMYDGKGTFDKRAFIINSGLRVCPYCGMEIIKPTNRTKKQIDHFFPKSKYPFLALSYYNLIPSCDTCNESPCKGAKDPLLLTKNERIMHPYYFKEDRIRFHLQINGADLYVDNNFQIKVGFSAKEERDGYDEFFDMIARYELHNIEAAQDYRKLLDIKALPFYTNLGIADVRQHLFAYGKGTDNPQSQQFYKMRNDIFKQFVGKQTVGDFYTKTSGNNTERF